MPRLFTGLEIPPEIAERLSFFRGGLPGARWIEPRKASSSPVTSPVTSSIGFMPSIFRSRPVPA